MSGQKICVVAASVSLVFVFPLPPCTDTTVDGSICDNTLARLPVSLPPTLCGVCMSDLLLFQFLLKIYFSYTQLDTRYRWLQLQELKPLLTTKKVQNQPVSNISLSFQSSISISYHTYGRKRLWYNVTVWMCVVSIYCG